MVKKCILFSLVIFMTMSVDAQKVNPKLANLINELEQQEQQIPELRKAELLELAQAINGILNEKGRAEVVFICTHNSRRSQLSQVWLRTVADVYHIKNIYTYSGGTESTAFNRRMVAAVERAGFLVDQTEPGNNPVYRVKINSGEKTTDRYFSKRYDDKYNPANGFIAVMVCSDADEACPLVEGAALRFSIPYLDPKAFDNTHEEAKAYDEKVKEIGREIIYLGKQLAL